MKKISKEKALELIQSTNGKIFSVKFIKRTTGEPRKMDCRTGVKKGTKGIGRNFDPLSKGLIGVFEMLHINHEPDDKHFRFINLDSLIQLKVSGTQYKVI